MTTEEKQIESFAISVAGSLNLDAREAIGHCGYCKPCIVAYLYGKFFGILDQIFHLLNMVRDALKLQQKEVHILELLEIFYDHKLQEERSNAIEALIQLLSFEQQKMAFARIGRLKMESEQVSNLFDGQNNLFGINSEEKSTGRKM